MKYMKEQKRVKHQPSWDEEGGGHFLGVFTLFSTKEMVVLLDQYIPNAKNVYHLSHKEPI